VAGKPGAAWSDVGGSGGGGGVSTGAPVNQSEQPAALQARTRCRYVCPVTRPVSVVPALFAAAFGRACHVLHTPPGGSVRRCTRKCDSLLLLSDHVTCTMSCASGVLSTPEGARAGPVSVAVSVAPA
jgi:hypothetical protein